MSTQLLIIMVRAKRALPTQFLLTVAALILCMAAVVQARQIKLRIEPPVDSPGTAIIEVVGRPLKVWSFPNSYAGVSELGKRIRSLSAFDAAGSEVQIRQLAPGEFETSTPATRFLYAVNLDPPQRASDSARVSWLVFTRGILLMADLLPIEETMAGGNNRVAEKTTVRFELPSDWTVYSSEVKNRSGEFELADSARAVFAIGRFPRHSEVNANGTNLDLLIDGKWAFADRDVIEMAGNILKSHRKVFGGIPFGRTALVLLPFPRSVPATQWSGETRGSTLTLLMGELPSKAGALAQLSTPLTHELFHLWVPNGLALEGDYDWFYEGFTMYQSARTAVRLELLTFPEFLDAIARAYDGSVAGETLERLSLLEASRRRWTSGTLSVYSKSMIVAFLFDLKMRNGGKGSLDEVYRKLFAQNGLSSPGAKSVRTVADGNEAAMSVLASNALAKDFVRSFVQEPISIDLQKELSPYGFMVEKQGLRTRITVSDKLSKQQRDLLRELGYNDVVRSPRR
jgi:hypothetical protein